MKKYRKSFVLLVVFCLLLSSSLSVSSEDIRVLEEPQTEVAEVAVVSAPTITNATLVTDIEGIFVLTNVGNGHTVRNVNYVAKTYNTDYSQQGQLLRIIPFDGLGVMNLPSQTHMIQTVIHTQYYMTAGTSSVTFTSLGSFPTINMLWYIYENNDGTYLFVPASNTSTMLCAPMTALEGYSPYFPNYAADNSFGKWHIASNYSWYSQKEPWYGWETDVYSYAREGALPVTSLIFDGGEYAGDSLTHAIDEAGCHLSSIAMIMANMDCYTANSRYDVRFGTSTNIFSDPYSVAMANLNLTDWSIASDGVLEGNWSNPMNAVYGYIHAQFDVLIDQEADIGSTVREKAEYITNAVNQSDGGIILRFSGHSIVCVSSSYTSETPLEDIDDCFIVFDPGKTNKDIASGVTLFENGRTLSNVVRIYTIVYN